MIALQRCLEIARIERAPERRLTARRAGAAWAFGRARKSTDRLDPETRSTPGVYHSVLKKFAWDKISVVNMMCTFSDLTIRLDQSQAGAALSVLSQIVAHG